MAAGLGGRIARFAGAMAGYLRIDRKASSCLNCASSLFRHICLSTLYCFATCDLNSKTNSYSLVRGGDDSRNDSVFRAAICDATNLLWTDSSKSGGCDVGVVCSNRIGSRTPPASSTVTADLTAGDTGGERGKRPVGFVGCRLKVSIGVDSGGDMRECLISILS